MWRQRTFYAVTMTAIRVLVTNALNAFRRITEVEAWNLAVNRGRVTV